MTHIGLHLKIIWLGCTVYVNKLISSFLKINLSSKPQSIGVRMVNFETFEHFPSLNMKILLWACAFDSRSQGSRIGYSWECEASWRQSSGMKFNISKPKHAFVGKNRNCEPRRNCWQLSDSVKLELQKIFLMFAFSSASKAFTVKASRALSAVKLSSNKIKFKYY